MKKLSILLALSLWCLGIVAQTQDRRSNPIVSHMFTADASAHVWQDGRLYVYPSTDVAPSKGYKTMDGYHVFSTNDMITWKDHGEILHSSDVSWGYEKGGYMWAPDCVFKNGIYYFYFPHYNKDGVWEIGVATSRNPASDFKVLGYVKGGRTFCDPCVYIDDDGQAYLYAVVNAKTYAAKLKDNMMEIDGEMVLQTGLDHHREGPFVFKRQGLYYLIYPDDYPKYNKMRYSVADNPLGPWQCKGVFVDHTDVITMHGSVVKYKGQWYLFYHNGSLSGGIATNRSICFDPVYFNEDGTIKMVQQTLGVTLPTFHNDINFNEMFGALPIGNYKKSDLKKHNIPDKAISSIQIPEGYTVECFEKDNFLGKSWIFNEDRINLGVIGCNNIISSLKISKSETDNLVKNASFELATQGLVKYWYNRSPKPFTRYRDTTAQAYYSLKHKGHGKPKSLVQSVKLKPHAKYELSVMMKIKAGTKGKVIFDTVGAIEKSCKFELEASTKSDEWVKFRNSINTGEATKIDLRCIMSPDFDGTCYWDDVELTEQ